MFFVLHIFLSKREMDRSEYLFPSPSDSNNLQKRKSVSQLRLMTASQQTRERNEWQEDLKNDEMIANWREKANRKGLTLTPVEFTTVVEQISEMVRYEVFNILIDI